MKAAGPPKLASWLLCRQVSGYRAESLIGDLTEEYSKGRSDNWYWRQVLIAVVRSYARLFRAFGLRALVAIAAGWCALVLGITLLDQLWVTLHREITSLDAGRPAKELETLHSLHPVAWTVFAACIDVLVGRLIVCLYRPHPKFIARFFIVSIVLYMAPSILRLLLQALSDSRHIVNLAAALASTILWTTSAWLGALWQIQSESEKGRNQF